jgi:ATP-dependent RNA helicase DDX3X
MDLPQGVAELPENMKPVTTFAGLDVGKVLSRNLSFAGFVQPTPVQGHSTPLAIGGWDVVSIAQTGSGKTLAFMLPILYRLLKDGPAPRSGNGGGGRNRPPVAIRALAMAPTRELAQQIHEESRKFAFRCGLRICVAYGGAPFGDQMREMERGCDVLVATPGRLDDMLTRGRVTLSQCTFLVLDEVTSCERTQVGCVVCLRHSCSR